MNDCSCAKCLSKICKTQPISMTIDYPRSFQTDYKSEFSGKISTEPLRMNLSSYKPDVPSLIQESIYKSQYRTLKTEKIAPIKQQQNLYTVNSLQLDDQSIYKRSFRSLTFQERTQPIKPSNVHCVSSLPMSAVRSTYRQNFGQRQFQYPQKCIVPYKLHTSGEWDKNIQSHYRQEHRGEMTEQAHKFKPNQNQLFIMNYQRKPQSQYQQDFRGKYIKCKNHEVNALAN